MKNNYQPLVFIIDDDVEIQALLSRLLTLENYRNETFSTALGALERLEESQSRESNRCDLIICDLKLPDLSGLELIERVHEKSWNIPILVITAHASVETAVEALKKGAFDYVVKPIHLSEIRIVISRAFELQSLEEERKSLKKKLNEYLYLPENVGEIVGKSQKIRQIFDLVERVAKSHSNILITGESGSGKELVARSIHKKSTRSQGPFVAINCSAIPDQLLESELFGHKKGSFTGAHENRRGLFEEAEGGSFFLDEIGDLALGLQAKLLRVLQERKIKPVGENQYKEIDVRIISASHKNIRQLVQEGKFREDLYYRISVIPVQVPALRERRDDIPILAEHFVRKLCRLNDLPDKKLTKPAMYKLLNLPWTGNVRELENTLERAIVLSNSEWIEDIDIQVEGVVSDSTQGLFSQLLTLEELEKQYIQYVLRTTYYSKEKTAEILGINRKTLYRKELEFGILQTPV